MAVYALSPASALETADPNRAISGDPSETRLLMALGAWIDIHISNPDLNLTQDDWEDFWASSSANAGYEARGPVATFQSRVLRHSSRGSHPDTSLSRMQRRLARIGASPAALQQMTAGRGLECVEEVCGWIEQKRAYGKTFEVFHPGAAGLSPLECRILDLAQRFLDDRGRPDFVRICQITSTTTRAAALQTLLRARRKVQNYWSRASIGIEEEE